jgi:hypothetical protein
MMCRHELAWRATRVTFEPGVESPHIDRNRETGEPIRSVLVDAKRCCDCGHWLPLGPSNDTGCEVEIRASELATKWKRVGGVRRIITEAERTGWHRWPYATPEGDEESAGWLAAQILNHEFDLGGVTWTGSHMADRPITEHEDSHD